MLVEFWVWVVELVVSLADLDLTSVKLCSISLAVVLLSKSLWSRSPPSRHPGRLGLSNLALHHLAHYRISLLSLAVVVAMFLGWLLWVVFGGFVFLDGCSGLCLVNLSGGWLILGWCCGFEIWDGAYGFEICGCVDRTINNWWVPKQIAQEPRTFIFLVGVQEVHMTKHSNYRILNRWELKTPCFIDLLLKKLWEQQVENKN